MLRSRPYDQDDTIGLDDLLDHLRSLLQQRDRCGFDVDNVQTCTVSVDVRRKR